MESQTKACALSAHASGSPRCSALCARDAGIYLADRIGLSGALPKQRMWQLAREGQISVVRIGRRIWFQTRALDAFAASGGTRAEVSNER